MWSVVKGFHISGNLAGQLRDLTGRGDQPSGKVVQEDLAEPLGNLLGTGDQSSGEEVPVTSAVHVKEATSTEPGRQEDDAKGCSRVLKLVKTGSLKTTLHYRR